jgi:hypothetical protein
LRFNRTKYTTSSVLISSAHKYDVKESIKLIAKYKGFSNGSNPSKHGRESEKKNAF